MSIAIVGAGQVGQAVGEAWTRKGHDVVYGVPDPAEARYQALGAHRVMTPTAAVQGAAVIVLAIPWSAAEPVCKGLGDLTGKIVIDCTNPLTMGADGLELKLGFSTSGGELVQNWCPGASVFKTLNQVGFEVMADASKASAPPVMMVAGDDAAAKPKVLSLVGDLGFEAVDAGPLKIARLLEPYAMLWINLALKQGLPRNVAFGLIPPASHDKTGDLS